MDVSIERVAAVLKTFAEAELSASTLQPVLDLAVELNPELRPQIVCAWCKKTMRDGSTPASHGICPPCNERAFNER